MGYGIVRSCAETYGFGNTAIISAIGLDIVTNDADEIMENAIASIPSKMI